MSRRQLKRNLKVTLMALIKYQVKFSELASLYSQHCSTSTTPIEKCQEIITSFFLLSQSMELASELLKKVLELI